MLLESIVQKISTPSWFEQINKGLADVLDTAYGYSMAWVLMGVLLTAGIYFTVTTKAVQIRLFGHMITTVGRSRKGAQGGISSFQAFAIGLADRMGTGNIAGVAMAVVAGGPGAVFWMWIVALVGMATSFIESTLAQIYKIRSADGTFRGGPAYYIQNGLGSRGWGIVFACLLIFAYGFAFQMVQANTLAQVADQSFGVQPWVSGLILLLITVPVILGGIRPVAKMSEFLAPIMAVVYVAVATAVIAVNYQAIPTVFADIFAGAFGLRGAVGGALGGFFIALQQGIRRGLFSNEAGMGSAPNAAATATVSHPVSQGLIQSLGVFVDTVIVCTATAFIVLSAGIYKGENVANGAQLTTDSVSQSLGSWTPPLLLVIIAAFGYSTLLGNYAYAEANSKFLFGVDSRAWFVKALVILSVALGAVLSLPVVWVIADWATAMMAIVNMVALLFLGKWALGALQDYQAQRAEGKTPDQIYFCATNNPYLPGELKTEAWNTEAVAKHKAEDERLAKQPVKGQLLERIIDSDL